MFTVMGITGKVGGAVAENLLAAGVKRCGAWCAIRGRRKPGLIAVWS